MPQADDLTLSVNGSIYGGWQQVTVKRSLKAIAGGFDLQVTDQWVEKQAAWQIIPGYTCKLKIGSDTLITGYVDRVSPSFSKDSRSIAVSGRDAAGDLVDCSVVSSSSMFSNTSLKGLAAQLLKPFGIGLTIDSTASIRAAIPFPVIRVNPGQGIFELLDQQARLRGLLITNDGQGNVVITLAGSTRCATALVQGENILAASADFDTKDRFSKYTVKAQDAGLDGNMDPSINLNIQSIATDPEVARYRPKVIHAEGAASSSICTQRAWWEAKVRAAKSAKFSVTVQGWRQGDGALWMPNRLVSLKSNWLGINSDFLIADVTFTKGDGGSLTQLGIERSDVFTADPTLLERKNPLIQQVQTDRNRR